MPYFTKYHVKEQSAPALLAPVRDSLRELERRTKHFTARLSLDPGADKSLNAAHEAIARARQEIDKLMEQHNG